MTAAVLVASPALAQDLTGTLKKIKETGSITIGHRDASIPFSYYDDKQQPVGFAWRSAATSSMRSRPS